MARDVLDDEVDDLVLEHDVRVVIRDQERDVIALAIQSLIYGRTQENTVRTLTGFRRKTMKFSARCIMNRVNLWHSIRSISSACLILMLSRMELIEGSMRTRSFSLREMVRGWRSTSLDALRGLSTHRRIEIGTHVRCFDLRLVVPFDDLLRNELHCLATARWYTYLRREVLKRERRGERGPHGGEVWAQNVGLCAKDVYSSSASCPPPRARPETRAPWSRSRRDRIRAEFAHALKFPQTRLCALHQLFLVNHASRTHFPSLPTQKWPFLSLSGGSRLLSTRRVHR